MTTAQNGERTTHTDTHINYGDRKKLFIQQEFNPTLHIQYYNILPLPQYNVHAPSNTEQ